MKKIHLLHFHPDSELRQKKMNKVVQEQTLYSVRKGFSHIDI